MTDRLEQQLPIDTVEVTFDVDVEHPVVAPTALTSLAYSVDRRSAGPIAIRVRVEHRLQIRLQVAPGGHRRRQLRRCLAGGLARRPIGAGRHRPGSDAPPDERVSVSCPCPRRPRSAGPEATYCRRRCRIRPRCAAPDSVRANIGGDRCLPAPRSSSVPLI